MGELSVVNKVFGNNMRKTPETTNFAAEEIQTVIAFVDNATSILFAVIYILLSSVIDVRHLNVLEESC